MNRSLLSAIAVSASLAFAGCGNGGSVASPIPLATARAPFSPGMSSSATFAYGADAIAGSQYVGPAHVGAVGVDVALTLANARGLASYASQVSSPGSPVFRKFLTPAQIGVQYGATSTTVDAAAKYFASYGLHVGSWPQRLSLHVTGSQSAMERAFGTTLGIFKAGTTTFVGPMTPPHLAQPLGIVSVGNLVTAPRSFRTAVLPSGGAVTLSGYTPQQIRTAFDYAGAYNAGFTGTGITVGIIGTGPISAADTAAYAQTFATAIAPVTQVNVTDQGVAAPGLENPPDTGFQTPPPVTAMCGGTLPSCNAEDVEAQVDTEAAASLAPGSNVLFYLGYTAGYCENGSGAITPAPCANGSTPYPLEGISVSDDEIQQAISDDNADVLSLSFGGAEQLNAGQEFSASDPTSGLGPSEFSALAAEGIAVFVSSGDSGAEGCQNPAFAPAINKPCVSYPSTDPHVVAVGGVNVPLTTFGTLTNQITGWGLSTEDGNGGSGGGISKYFPQTLTPWQTGLPGMIGTNRNVPDVSLLGDDHTGMSVLYDAQFGTKVIPVGGTSVAAPQMAAMWALVLQACSQSSACATASGPKAYRLGNPAPLLYPLYASGGTIAPTYAQTFYDVVYGGNSAASTTTLGAFDPGYFAGPGYDQVTGIGVPFARALIKAVTHQ